eukprot:gb/GECG01009638.1/.p1 GENE.gb/GECG01009638.1/~~gb/GECG01009638.1/.p1  ORF type:complete len:261 (+),score=31.16 gb/GECG01009638.1/:1-783(+)
MITICPLVVCKDCTLSDTKMASRFISALRGKSGSPGGAQSGSFHRGQRGLYGGKRIVFGNNVSHSERKTRRSWKPNSQYVTLWSENLGQKIPTRATAYSLRWMDKRGGLDNYLINTPDYKLASQEALRLKKLVIRARAEKQRNRAQADKEGISLEELERRKEEEKQERIRKFTPPGVVWLGDLEEPVGETQTADTSAPKTDEWHSLWSDDEEDVEDPSKAKHRYWKTKTGKTMVLTPEQYKQRQATVHAMKKTRVIRMGV